MRRKLSLSVIIATITLIAFMTAAYAGSGTVYTINLDEMLGQYYLSGTPNLIRVGDTSTIVLNDPVVVTGSGMDPMESEGYKLVLGGYPDFDKSRIIDDKSTKFNGKDLLSYDLVVVGGPEHNAFTNSLMKRGYLTYNTTNKKMPAGVIEVISTPGGHTVVVIGDVDGWPYKKKDLPFGIPEEVAPVGAVAVGAGIGIIGIFLSKGLNLLWALLLKFWNFLTGYVVTHVQEGASEKEIKMRKLKAQKKKPFVLGLSKLELLVAPACAILFGLAYVLADRTAIDPGNILFYIIVAGLALIGHDVAHKLIAHFYNAESEYKFWGLGTITMFFTSWLFGTVFAQPARTILDDSELDIKKVGYVMLAGPAVSMVLSIGFALLMPLGGVISMVEVAAGSTLNIGIAVLAIGTLGFSMNLLSTVYSLMPFNPMDGAKVFKWNKWAWAVVFFPLLVFYLAIMLLFL